MTATAFRMVLGLRLRDADREDCDIVVDGGLREVSSLLPRLTRNFFGGTCTNSSANAVLKRLVGLPEDGDEDMIQSGLRFDSESVYRSLVPK